jgi:hypothetical protein
MSPDTSRYNSPSKIDHHTGAVDSPLPRTDLGLASTATAASPTSFADEARKRLWMTK